MTIYNDNDNPFGLSPDERRVIYHWQKGDTMTDAYKKVMLSEYDKQAISELALKKRVQRFFDTYRIREAMAATPGERGEKAKKDFEKWKNSQKEEQVKRLKPNERTFREIQRDYDNKVFEEEVIRRGGGPKKEQRELDKEAWLESLNINKDPSAMTVYGTGQFLTYVAVKEIMARQAEIKLKGISPLDKNGSALTPTIISALKTAAAMVLPYAPAPSAEDRREMSKAAVLLGLFPDNIQEDPDAYTAPIPNAIDVGENQ